MTRAHHPRSYRSGHDAAHDTGARRLVRDPPPGPARRPLVRLVRRPRPLPHRPTAPPSCAAPSSTRPRCTACCTSSATSGSRCSPSPRPTPTPRRPRPIDLNPPQPPGSPRATHQEARMTTTQHTRTVDRQPAPDPTRRAATIVGWLFIVTYVTSIAAKIGFYPPLFDGNYVTGPGQDTRVLWGAVRSSASSSSPTSAPRSRCTRSSSTVPQPRPRLRHRPDHGERLHRCRHPRRPHRRHDAPGLRGRRRAVRRRPRRRRGRVPRHAGMDLQPRARRSSSASATGCILGWMMFRTGLVPRQLCRARSHRRPAHHRSPVPQPSSDLIEPGGATPAASPPRRSSSGSSAWASTSS